MPSFFELLEQARGGNLPSRQQESFPGFNTDMSPAQEGFLFTAPAFDNRAFFESRGLDPITGLPIPPESPLFSFQRPEEIEASQEEDFDTSTPGDRAGNPDAPGGVVGDVAANVFGALGLAALGGPVGLGINMSRGINNPQAGPLELNMPAAFGLVGFDDPFSAPGSFGNVGDFGTTNPGLAGALDEGFNDVGLNETNSPGFDDPGANFGAFGDQTPGGVAEDEPGGDAGGGADERVICTELCRQGLMDRKLLVADLRYSQKHIGSITLLGYHFWAKPYVRLMKRSKLATAFIKPFGVLRAKECAWQLCQADKACWPGKLIRLLGEPLCHSIGVLVLLRQEISRLAGPMLQRLHRYKSPAPSIR